MPLKRGTSRKVVESNIEEFHGGPTYAKTAAKYGKARADAQAVAVAMDEKRRSGHAGRMRTRHGRTI